MSSHDADVLRRDFGPFIDGLKDGQALLEAVNELCRAKSYDQILDASRQIFIRQLSFDEWTLDVGSRVGNSGMYSSVHGIASFGDFKIIVAHLNTYVPLSTT